MATTVIALFLFMVLITTFVGKKDIFHPTRLYVILYTLLFAIYSLRLSRFQEPWSTSTLMLFGGAVFLFIAGGWLISFYAKHLHTSEKADFTAVPQMLCSKENNINWRWFLSIALCFFLFFIASYLFCFLKYHTIPLFSNHPGSDRFLFLSGNMIIGFGGGSGTLVMMLCAEVLLVKSSSKKQKLLAGILFTLSFILYFTFVTRMPLVRCFLYIAVLYHYIKKQISFKLLVVAALCFSLFFIGAALIRVDASGFSDLAVSLRLKVPDKYLLFATPYAYAVNNIWNMDFGFKKFIDGSSGYNFSHGFELFRGLFYFIPNWDAIIQNSYHFDSLFNESVVKISGLNTVIYVWHFFKDFGIFGVFFLSLLFSLGIHLFYYNTLLAPSYFRITIFGTIVTLILFSFMIPLWSFWNIYFELFALTVAHRSVKLL